MTKTIATFDRMGRNHKPPIVTVESDDPDEIAEAIYRVARKHLMSRDVEVVVNLEAMTATIYAGVQVGGSGSLHFA